MVKVCRGLCAPGLVVVEVEEGGRRRRLERNPWVGWAWMEKATLMISALLHSASNRVARWGYEVANFYLLHVGPILACTLYCWG